MKALGITAMIFAIVAIFAPVVGPYITVISALLAAFAAGGGLTFGVVALLVNILNIIVLSPSLWVAAAMAEAGQAGSGQDIAMGLGVLLVGAQVVAAVVLLVVHAVTKKGRNSA